MGCPLPRIIFWGQISSAKKMMGSIMFRKPSTYYFISLPFYQTCHFSQSKFKPLLDCGKCLFASQNYYQPQNYYHSIPYFCYGRKKRFQHSMLCFLLCYEAKIIYVKLLQMFNQGQKLNGEINIAVGGSITLVGNFLILMINPPFLKNLILVIFLLLS